MRFYHGTPSDYRRPRPNRLGVLWLARNQKVALEYALPYYKQKGFLWTIELADNARIVPLNDLREPAILALFNATNEARNMGPWTEKQWSESADFGLFEQFQWAAKFLAKRRVDGANVRDVLGTTPVAHPSVALVRPAAIVSATRVPVERSGRDTRTIEEIQTAIEQWEQGNG